MAKYSRRWYKKYRKYKRYSRRYKKYKASLRAINATDRSRCKIKSTAFITTHMTVEAGDDSTKVGCLNPFVVNQQINVPQTYWCYRGSTIDQPVPIAFTKIYDEFKVDMVVIKFTVTSNVGVGGMDCLRLLTSWDRKGTYADTSLDDYYPTASTMEAMANTECSILTNNTVNTFYRYCKATDFLEKYSWADCTLATVNGRIRQDPDLPWVNTSQMYGSTAWFDADNNVPFFSPTFYYALQCVNWTPTTDQAINVTIEMTTYYTFRNPKGTGIPSVSYSRRKQKTVEVGTAVRERQRLAQGVGLGDGTMMVTTKTGKRVRVVVPEGIQLSGLDEETLATKAMMKRMNVSDIPPPAATAAADTAME